MSDLTELQNQLKILKDAVSYGEKVKLLKSNSLFKEIILQDFCIKEMQRCAGLAVSEKVNPDLRNLANEMSKAGAVLTNFLNYIETAGNVAAGEISEVEDEIVKLETNKETE